MLLSLAILRVLPSVLRGVGESGDIPANAYRTPDGSDYYQTPDGADYYAEP